MVAARHAPTGATGSPIVLSPQVTLHDRANLLALPVVGSLVLAGLFGYIDTMLVSAASGGRGLLVVAACCAPTHPGLHSCTEPSLSDPAALQVTKTFILYICAGKRRCRCCCRGPGWCACLALLTATCPSLWPRVQSVELLLLLPPPCTCSCRCFH